VRAASGCVWHEAARAGSIGSATGRPARQRSDMDKKAKTPKKPKQNKTKTAK
jgi:hypothetical protein